MEKVTIEGMRALEFSVMQASSDSIVYINGSSLFKNCTGAKSSISILKALKFEIHDSRIENTDSMVIMN